MFEWKTHKTHRQSCYPRVIAHTWQLLDSSLSKEWHIFTRNFLKILYLEHRHHHKEKSKEVSEVIPMTVHVQ